MQSDKHLYNVKTIQHQQQQKDKMNGQPGMSAATISGNTVVSQPGGSAIPARLLAEKQEQLQNLMQQVREIWVVSQSEIDQRIRLGQA